MGRQNVRRDQVRKGNGRAIRKIAPAYRPVYSRMMSKSLEAFKLRHDEPATPERVAASAAFVGRALSAAFPSLPDGSVTLVVTNFLMGTAVRARSPEGWKAVDRLIEFLDNPTKVLDRDPSAIAMASVLASPGPALLRAQILLPRCRKPIAVLDERFVKRMRALTSLARSEPALRGSTVIYSPVYRVGRWDEDRGTKVRIRIGGECHDIDLANEDEADSFFEAAKSKRTYPIHLSAAWERGGDGQLRYDIKATKATRVDRNWKQLSGAEFVATIQTIAPSGYVDDDEFEDRTAMIRQRRQ